MVLILPRGRPAPRTVAVFCPDEDRRGNLGRIVQDSFSHTLFPSIAGTGRETCVHAYAVVSCCELPDIHTQFTILSVEAEEFLERDLSQRPPEY